MNNRFCHKIRRDCIFHEECRSGAKESKDGLIDSILTEDLVEKAEFILNLRKIIKMEEVELEEIDRLKKEFGGYEFGIYSYKGKYKDNTFTLLIGKNITDIKNYMRMDLINDFKKRIFGTGILLGYPSCCIDSHKNDINSVNDERESDLRQYDIFDSGIPCRLLNPEYKLYVHKPCGSSCISTISNCEKVLSYIRHAYGHEYIESFFGKGSIE